jgi:hypothetical protein
MKKPTCNGRFVDWSTIIRKMRVAKVTGSKTKFRNIFLAFVTASMY